MLLSADRADRFRPYHLQSLTDWKEVNYVDNDKQLQVIEARQPCANIRKKFSDVPGLI